MAKRGRRFKCGDTVESIRQAIDDLYFERGMRLLNGCPEIQQSFFASWPGKRSTKRAKLTQIRRMRARGYAVLIWPCREGTEPKVPLARRRVRKLIPYAGAERAATIAI
jgi:hypothetical protein